MRYLTANDIKKVFSMRQAIEADREALSLYSAGKADIPLRANIAVAKHHGQSLYMPGYVSGTQAALGIKIVSVYPDNPQKKLPSVPATMITLDAATGIVNAVLDGTYLTQLRTGAIQGLATELLAKKDARQALLIGTGGQAMAQLEAMLTVRDLKKVYIFDLEQKRAQQFVQQAADKFAGKFSTEFAATADPNQVVAQVEIITTVTTSHRATFDGRLVKAGTHINGIGAYTPEMCELPVELLQKADRIFFDTNDGVLAEAGDIIQPLKSNQIDQNKFNGELGQLINGQTAGRTTTDQITVFKTVGTAAVDVVAADRIVRAAQKANVGTMLA